MEKKSLFMKKLEERNNPIIIANDGAFSGKNGDIIKTLYFVVRACLNLTAEIDFCCGFVNGVCETNKKRHDESIKDRFYKRRCCCSGCFGSVGYLYNALPILPEDLHVYESLFKRGIGFWRTGKGCSLPRHLRSSICVFYSCASRTGALRADHLYSAKIRCDVAISQIKHLMAKQDKDNKKKGKRS